MPVNIICYELGICSVLGLRKTSGILLRWRMSNPKQMSVSVISSCQNPLFWAESGRSLFQQSCATPPWTQVSSYYYRSVTSFLNLNKFHEGRDFFTTLSKHLVWTSGGLVTKSCPVLAAPWTVAHQTSLSMEFPRQEYWSGLPFPPLGDLPIPGIECRSTALQLDSLPTGLPGKPWYGLEKSINTG